MVRGTPKYVELATALQDLILERNLGPHALLPSERELSDQFDVSRMTARQAVTLLETEGRVYRKPPRGTFVAEPRVRFRIGSFSEEVRRLGKRPSAKLLWSGVETLPVAVRTAMGVKGRTQAHVLRRLRLIDAEPVAIETTYYPANRTPQLLQRTDEADLAGSLWDLLRTTYSIELVRSEAQIESIIIDDVSCGHLGIRTASPGLLQTRLSYEATGRCVEYARDIYRADRAIFDVTEPIAAPSPRRNG